MRSPPAFTIPPRERLILCKIHRMPGVPPEDPDALPATRFINAIRRIDAANLEDPETVLINGSPVPGELLYSRRMSDWLDRLEPRASEALKLAVRAQHLRRWEIPRETFPG